MPLSPEQQKLIEKQLTPSVELADEQGGLLELAKLANNPLLIKQLEENKKNIAQFCKQYNIELYQLLSIEPATKGAKFLENFHDIFSDFRYNFEEKHKQLMQWQLQLQLELEKANTGLINQHAQAYLSVADELQKTGNLNTQTLFTVKDMETLLPNHGTENNDILISKPISVSTFDYEHDTTLQQLIAENEDKTVFIPCIEDGHWFYLQREANQTDWTIQDSQPFKQPDNQLTPRQQTILEKSHDLLKEIDNPDVEEPEYWSTEEQTNNFDCATHVINAYETKVDVDYEPKTHTELVTKIAKEKAPEAYQKFTENLSGLVNSQTVKIASALEDKADRTYQSYKELENAYSEIIENVQLTNTALSKLTSEQQEKVHRQNPDIRNNQKNLDEKLAWQLQQEEYKSYNQLSSDERGKIEQNPPKLFQEYLDKLQPEQSFGVEL
ncbi:MAG: hypothetical protein EP298_07055 [Gammaproteobacteria bacterium]|nr:MAG: hypothetical protein EP298_07055 [Gammaproteobacteria bacterium]UTW42993.1 hypothetical protein KFE69_02295 [bacterium SCSIO 12844]